MRIACRRWGRPCHPVGFFPKHNVSLEGPRALTARVGSGLVFLAVGAAGSLIT